MTRSFLAALLVIAILSACSGGEGESGDTSQETTTRDEVTDSGKATAPDEPGVAEDPDDVTSPLDIESVSAVRAGDLLAVSMTMHEGWEDDVLAGPQADRPGANRLSVLYDTNLDGRADYTGTIVFAEGTLSVVIAGQGQAFEPVPVERPDDSTAQFVHPIDVFFVALGQEEVESEVDIQIAIESEVEGGRDQAPEEDWLLVAVGP